MTCGELRSFLDTVRARAPRATTFGFCVLRPEGENTLESSATDPDDLILSNLWQRLGDGLLIGAYARSGGYALRRYMLFPYLYCGEPGEAATREWLRRAINFDAFLLQQGDRINRGSREEHTR